MDWEDAFPGSGEGVGEGTGALSGHCDFHVLGWLPLPIVTVSLVVRPLRRCRTDITSHELGDSRHFVTVLQDMPPFRNRK